MIEMGRSCSQNGRRSFFFKILIGNLLEMTLRKAKAEIGGQY
jgi:hypothetical protein